MLLAAAAPPATAQPPIEFDHRARWLPQGSAIEMLTPRDAKSSPSLFISPRALTDTNEQAARGALYQHPIGVRRITSIRLILPETYQPIGALAYLKKLGVINIDRGNEWMAELTFDGGKKKTLKDLRPDLPLVIRY